MRMSVSAGAACQFDGAEFQAVHGNGAAPWVAEWGEDLRV